MMRRGALLLALVVHGYPAQLCLDEGADLKTCDCFPFCPTSLRAKAIAGSNVPPNASWHALPLASPTDSQHNQHTQRESALNVDLRRAVAVSPRAFSPEECRVMRAEVDAHLGAGTEGGLSDLGLNSETFSRKALLASPTVEL